MKLDYDAVRNLDVETSALLDILADPRRRFVLACIREHDVPLALSDVAREFVAWDQDVAITEIRAEDAKSAHVALHHVHVPKLAAFGAVHYDQEQDTVARVENTDALASAVNLPRSSNDSDH